MTVKTVADEQLLMQLGEASTKWWAVYGKLKKGKLPSDQVLGALQAIHDGKFAAEGPGTIVVPQRPRFIHGLFTPPGQMVTNVRQWDAAHLETWKDVPISDWISKLGPAPAWPDGRLQCVVLELALPDQPETKDAEGNVIPGVPGYIRTVRDLWGIIFGQHPNVWKWDQFLLDQEHLFLLDGATYEPGLRWRVLDLGANWDKTNGIAPATVRDPIASPNVDGFAALANHPRYVRRMNGKTIPFTWIAGFHVAVPANVPRRHAPIAYFRRNGRQVHLCAHGDGSRYSSYSVPVRLGGGGTRS